MDYWRHAVHASWHATLELLTGGIVPAMIAAAVFVLGTVLSHRVRGKEAGMEWVWDGFFGLMATIVVGMATFLVYLLSVFPVKTYSAFSNEKVALAHAQAEKDLLQSDLKKANDRATALSDSLAMIKGDHVEPDEWPPLSREQVGQWVTALSGKSIVSVKVLWAGDVNARRFFRSFQQVGKQLNFDVLAPRGGNEGSVIIIHAAQNDPAGPALLKLFETMGQTKINVIPSSTTGNIEVYLPEK